MSSSSSSYLPSHAQPGPKLSKRNHWVDPDALPNASISTLEHFDVARIAGNAPLEAKRLALNTFAAYGVGESEAFGHAAGRKVRFTKIDVRLDGRGAGSEDGGSVTSANVVAEITVDNSMVNGNGMMHGGCISYLVDNCAGMPLVVLGILRGINGVGVTQAMNVLFHAPAPLGSTLEIVSTSLALGRRSMSSKCEIFNKTTKRLVASAFVNKMQPKL